MIIAYWESDQACSRDHQVVHYNFIMKLMVNGEKS